MTTLVAPSLLEAVVPDLGDIKDVPVIEVLAKVGDQIAVDQTLVVIETEKATMDVPSTCAGIVRELIVKVGDAINCGSVLMLLEPLEEVSRPPAKASQPAKPSLVPTAPAAALAPAQVLAPVPAIVAPAPVQPEPNQPARVSLNHSAPAGQPLDGNTGASLPHASPSIRRFAREFGLDLARVFGTGPKGRILHSDLQTFVKAAVAHPQVAPKAREASAGLDLLPWPEVDFARYGPVERAELSKIRKISGANLQPQRHPHSARHQLR